MTQVLKALSPRRPMEVSAYETLQDKIRLPETVSINTDNFEEFLTEFILKIGSVRGLKIPLEFTCPQKEDPNFEKRVLSVLTNEAEPRPKLKRLFKELATAQSLFQLADDNLKAYVLQCAGKSSTLRRKIIRHQGDSLSLLSDLAKDYDKTSSDNAISAEAKIFQLSYDTLTTNEEFIEKLEAGVTAVENAGGSFSLDKLAQILLNQAKASERYKIPVASYITSLQREGKLPEWAETKQYMLTLDRTTKAIEAPEKILFTSANKPKSKYHFCKRCNTRHPAGQHELQRKQNPAEIVAAAVEIIERKRQLSRPSGNFQGRCFFCNKVGHTKKQCFKNPENQAKKSGYHSREQATYTRAADSTASDYYEALDRSTRGRYAYVLSDAAHAVFDSDETKKFLMLYDTAATKIFLRNSWHEFESSRLVQREVSTAGSGKLRTIREGNVGGFTAYGMSDELQVQLCGGQALAQKGYIVQIDHLGATITNRFYQNEAPYCVPWNEGLLLINMQELVTFNSKTKNPKLTSASPSRIPTLRANITNEYTFSHSHTPTRQTVQSPPIAGGARRIDGPFSDDDEGPFDFAANHKRKQVAVKIPSRTASTVSTPVLISDDDDEAESNIDA